MKTKTMKVTPAIAMEWQRRTSTAQRPLNNSHVQYLSSEMTAGRWKNDGTPIRFDDDGNMIDGQHRVAAVIDSGVPIEALVIEEMDAGVFATIDSGRIRKMSDTIACAGASQSIMTAAAAITRLVAGWDDKTGLGAASLGKKSPVVILEIWNKHRAEIESAATFVYGKKGRRRLCRPSVLGFAYMLFCRINPDDAVAFIDMVADGADLERGSGPYLLNRYFSNDRGHSLDVPYMLLPVIIKAWNMWRLGKRGEQLHYRVTETFPLPQ